jgi:hypothetical protein
MPAKAGIRLFQKHRVPASAGTSGRLNYERRGWIGGFTSAGIGEM